jgi:hypothetical protein
MELLASQIEGQEHMAIHKDTKDFLSRVDSIQSKYLQLIVERQNEDSPKGAEEQRDLESTDESSHHTDSGQGAF